MTATSYSDHLRHSPFAPPHLRRSNVVPNQLLFRELNEEVSLRRDPAGGGGGEFEAVCECEHRNCSELISLTRDRYEAIRRFPTRFVVRPGHWSPGDERVVEQHEGFAVVEKTGASARIAIHLDPRARRQDSRPAAA